MSSRKGLVASRGAFKGAVSKLMGQIDKCKKDPDFYIDLLKDRQNTIRRLTNDIVDTLETEAEMSKEIELQIEYDDSLMQFIRMLETAKTTGNVSTSTLNSGQTRVTNTTAKLPKLQLKKFTGNIVEWQAFWDAFRDTVHNSTQLTSVEKFHYLYSLLEGTAVRAIQGLQLTSNNYDIAVKLLKERFGNKQKIINAYIEKLNRVRFVSNVDASSLRSFHDYIKIQKEALKGIGVDSKTYETLLVPQLLAKLPEAFRMKIIEECGCQNQISLDDFLTAISKQVELRECCQMRPSSINNQSTTATRKNEHSRNSHYTNQSKPFLNSTLRTFHTTAQTPKCQFCHGEHSKNIEVSKSAKQL